MALEVERNRTQYRIEVGVGRGDWARLMVGMSIRLPLLVADPKINEAFMGEAFHSMSQKTLNATEKKILCTDQSAVHNNTCFVIYINYKSTCM